MTRKFVVIHEAQADIATATEIADRVLLDTVDWLDHPLDDHRRWIGEESPGKHLSWQAIPTFARELGMRVHGHFDGDAGLPDAKAARRAITYVLSQLANIEAILLIRDVDDQLKRRDGLKQARRDHKSGCEIVVGVAIIERENWVICGFEPVDDAERAKLESETQTLGWDPRLRSHDLTAGKDDNAPKSPKRVLRALTDGNRDREQDCWKPTPLATLRERGKENGLADYLDEIRDYLVPIFTGHAAHA